MVDQDFGAGALASASSRPLGAQRPKLHDIGPIDTLIIGAAQALAIIPGVSRSGITIAIARWRGIERGAAARFSFLVGTPLIAGAALFKLRYLADTPGALNGPVRRWYRNCSRRWCAQHWPSTSLPRASWPGIFVSYRLLLAGLVVATILLGLR